jgi:hypothetical protein
LSPDYQAKVHNALDKTKIFSFNFANDNIAWKSNNEGFGSLNHWAAESGYSFCPGGHIGQTAHTNFASELYNTL